MREKFVQNGVKFLDKVIDISMRNDNQQQQRAWGSMGSIFGGILVPLFESPAVNNHLVNNREFIIAAATGLVIFFTPAGRAVEKLGDAIHYGIDLLHPKVQIRKAKHP